MVIGRGTVGDEDSLIHIRIRSEKVGGEPPEIRRIDGAGSDWKCNGADIVQVQIVDEGG